MRKNVMERVIDKQFMPMALVLKSFKEDVRNAPHKTLTVCVEREEGYNYIYKLDIFKDNDVRNYEVAERIVKTLIWLVGGFRVYVAGDAYIAGRLKDDYRKGGAREFDADFMAFPRRPWVPSPIRLTRSFSRPRRRGYKRAS